MASSTPVSIDHAHTPTSFEISQLRLRRHSGAAVLGHRKDRFSGLHDGGNHATYLGAIEGLNATDDDDVEEIRELIVQTLLQGEVGTTIAEISTCNPDLANLEVPERSIELLAPSINMIGIRASQGTLRPIANVYLNCPFESDMDWNRLLNAVAKTKSSTPSWESDYPAWVDLYCMSWCGPPFGLCPLPSVPGWIRAMPIAPIVSIGTGSAGNPSPRSS